MSLSLSALLLLLALRAVATVCSYAAGTPGGVFAPILGLATVAGVAYAEAVHLLVPGLALEPTAFAAAAMAALFTGSVRAPLVGVVLVAELTDAYPAVVAITLSSAMASLTAAALRGRPLYELLLERTLAAAAMSSAVGVGRAHRRLRREELVPLRQCRSRLAASRRPQSGSRDSPGHRRW